ncbi:MAG: PAS domain S-box protein [Spirochaetes bacterium]|nr:PAS domain S-box protein [Spirochaetota bacterium]
MTQTRILIVEDEAIVGMHIQSTLLKLGYEVCGSAKTGEDAVSMAAELHPDLILMDIVLAGSMDGIEAAKVIKQTLSIPVVYMTGNADVATISRARDTDPHGYILKPVNILHLYSMIDTALHRHKLERRLVESEEKYRFITDKMSDMVWTMDLNMRTTFAGPSIVNTLGFTPEERYAQKVEEQLTPESLTMIMKRFAVELKRDSEMGIDPERTITMEVEYYHKNGSTVWVENKMRAIRDREGRIIGIHGVSRDISERRRAEEALRNSECRFRALVDNLEDFVLIMDQAGVVTFENPITAASLGFSIMGKNAFEFIHPDDRERVLKDFKDVITRTNPHLPTLFRVRKLDNTWIHLEALATNMTDDPGIRGLLVMCHDVTQRVEAQQALHESEKRFRALIQNLQEMVVIMDAEGVVLFENPSTMKILGQSLFGKSVFDYIHPDDVESTRMAYLQVLDRTNDENPHLFRVRHANGSWLYMDAIAENLIDDESIRGNLVVCRDVTRRVKAEKDLRDSRQRYHALFHQSPAGVFMFSKDLVLTECNARLAEIMGSKRESIIGIDLKNLRNESLVRQLQDTINGNNNTYEGPYQAITSDTSLWISVTASPVRDDLGIVVGGMAVVSDLTDRKRAEESLSISEERNRLLVDNANEGIVVLQDWRFVFVNPRFIDITGYTREHLYSRAFTEFIHPDDRAMISERYRKRLGGDMTPFTYEARLIGREGAIKWIELNSVLFNWEGNPAVLLFVRDIGERKKAEEERRKIEAQIQQTQKLESLGVLAGGIAHDFNNLLMAILGNIDLALLDMSPVSPSRSNLQEAAKASQRAADLCRQMLAYSGKGRFLSEILDLNDVVEDMKHMLDLSVSKKAMLRYHFAPGLPSIEADATQMRQIIMNLVINASDAISEKSGIISISTGAMECDREFLAGSWLNEELPAGTYVYIEVADTGCGMDRAMLPKIFDPFFTTKFTGRGLGLAAVLGIVRSHKGAIRLHSERGRGTAFKIFLPAVEAPAERQPGGRGTEDGWRGSGTVLLVDDEETIRSLGKRMLERFGLTVLTASNGKEALDIFRERPDEIACVILDLTMPQMDGEEAFHELRKLRNGVPVIMSSGYNEQEITHRFTGKGPDGFIQKPYQMDILAGKLKEILG